jgi:hypothetical protein
MDRAVLPAGWTLTEIPSVIVGVAPNATTGTKNTNPPTNKTMHASAESLFAFLSISLSRVGFEHPEQSPQRQPGRHRGHEHLAGSC